MDPKNTSQQKSKQSMSSMNNNPSSHRPKTPTSGSSGLRHTSTKPSLATTSAKLPSSLRSQPGSSSHAGGSKSRALSPTAKPSSVITSPAKTPGKSSNTGGGSSSYKTSVVSTPARTSFTTSLGNKSSPSKSNQASSSGKSSLSQHSSKNINASQASKATVSFSPKVAASSNNNATTNSSKPTEKTDTTPQPQQSQNVQKPPLAAAPSTPATTQQTVPANANNTSQPQNSQSASQSTAIVPANVTTTVSNNYRPGVNNVQQQQVQHQPGAPYKSSFIGTFPNIDPSSFPRAMNLPYGHGPKASVSKSLTVGMDRSRNLRAFVEKAMAERKIFTCVGVYPAVKNALKKRGWVEKQGPLNMVRSANNGIMNNNNSMEEESDAAWVSRNLRDYPPDFIWVIRRDNIDWKGLHKDQLINRFPRAWFTTKVGIVACLQQLHWFSEPGISDTFFPRCYRLCLEDERHAFQDDYRMTACMSLLRWFVEQFETKGSMSLVDTTSKITSLSIDFATRQLSNYIKIRRHEDIDWHLSPSFMPQHWEAFLTQYYNVVHDKKRIRFDSEEAVKAKYEMAKRTLGRMGHYWPQAHFDGVYNMWICKPGARSRGKGIVIMNTMEKIMELLSQNNYREANWVVQKYMERPLLIYKTKFDIRQWFIITDWTPLTLWFYKESYVRFCTKPFALEDFHESIHLCNNAIQCRYQNSELRDSALPDENMWDCYTFQAYLKTIGKLDEWPKIYEGMKQAIIGVLLASQENVDTRKGCFELYGADFMLAEDFKPWLIEINSCPCMAASTSVTARMCAQCLDDVIKVVVDRKANKNADTGMFEMVFKQNPSAMMVQQFTGHDLVVQGKKLTRELDWPGVMVPKSINSGLKTKSSTSPPTVTVASSGPTQKSGLSLAQPHENLTFADLLQRLRMKNVAILQGRTRNPKDMQDDNGNKDQNGTSNSSAMISGMKRVYPKHAGVASKYRQTASGSKSGGKSDKNNEDPSFAYISKYAADGIDLSNIIRLKETLQKENEENRPRGISGKENSSSYGNPYLPSSSIRTMDDMKAALSQKYCKSELSSPCDSLSDLTFPNINPNSPSSPQSPRSPSASLGPDTEGLEEHAQQSKHSETEIRVEERPSTPLIDLSSPPTQSAPELSSPPSHSTPQLPALTGGKDDILTISDILNNNYVIESSIFKFPAVINSASESSSESNSDSGTDFLDNMITPYPSSFHRTSEERVRRFQGINVTKKKASVRSLSHHRTHVHHRHSHPKFPCHKISLETPLHMGSGRRSAPTFPLKKINLKLS